MSYLLNASALLPTIIRLGSKLIDIKDKVQLSTTDLAVYEVGNSLWKLSTHLRSIMLKEAEDILIALMDVTNRNIIKTYKFDDLIITDILRLACKEKLTFYDASYISAAENIKASLVTEDKKMIKTASKHVETLTYKDFQHELEKLM